MARILRQAALDRESTSARVGLAGASVRRAFRLAAGDGGDPDDTVYLYLDEVGALKQLPRNSRAAALAARCGFGDVPFHGDMFIGRVRSSGDRRWNVDFGVEELVPFLKEHNL